jgi:hypothetical protein
MTYACSAGSLFNVIATKIDKFYNTATILVPYFQKKKYYCNKSSIICQNILTYLISGAHIKGH